MPLVENHQPATKVRREESLSRLEKLILRGVSNSYDLSTTLGVSEKTVFLWKEELRKRWKEETNSTEIADNRIKRTKQIENIAVLALDEFDRSREPQTETTHQHKQCEACHGTGINIQGINVPPKIREAVFDRDGFKCVMCDSTTNLTLDHIIPRSKGGSHQESNLRVLCFTCNRIKSDKLDPNSKCEECSGEGQEEYQPNKYRQCVKCQGTGAKPDLPVCQECQGSGRITVTTIKTKQMIGDPAFLSVAKGCIEAVAKFEGAMPMDRKVGSLTDLTIGIGGEIHQKTLELYEQPMPSELVLRFMSTVDEIETCQRKGKLQPKVAIECRPHKPEDDPEENDDEDF